MVTLLIQDIKDTVAFQLRRPELCLLISQQPITLYGIAASPASYCDCYLTGTWSAWSWRWLAIAASTTGNQKRSSLRHLKNSIPQGSVLAALLFNIYISDLPSANHHLEKVCIQQRPRNHACWWRLAGSGRGAEQGHGNHRWIPSELEAEAQHYKMV